MTDVRSKPSTELMSNVYASRRDRSPREAKGMANSDTVMQRLESGLPLKDALMPGASYEGWHSHCKLFPKWAARAKALAAHNAEAGRLRKLEKAGVFRKRSQTHCLRGHKYTAENTRLKTYNGYTTRQCKKCESERKAERGPLLKAEMIAKLIEAMKRKLKFNAIRRICPDITAFYRTVRKVPELRAVHHEWVSGGRSRAAAAAKRTNAQKRYQEVMRLLPGRMHLDVKIEIANAVYEAHALRRYKGKPFGITKARTRIKEFIADYYRENPVRAFGDVKAPWSLDALVGHDTNVRLIDTVSKGLW